MLTITVRPIKPGRYAALLDGRTLLPSAKEPFLAAARVLQAEGAPDDTPIRMVYEDSPSVTCLTSTIGKAAGLSVEDSNTTPPRLRPYVRPELGTQDPTAVTEYVQNAQEAA